MSSYSLRCRVCEEVTVPVPLDHCRRCDGPTDVAYDWDWVRTHTTRAGIAAGPPSLWRYRQLLPGAARLDFGAGWTPLVRADRLSSLLGIDLHLKLENANPTLSFKDRLATIAAQVAIDHGVTTLCCSSTGNLGDAVAAAAAAAGLEAIVLAPAGEASIGSTAAAAGAKVFAVRGGYDDCRRLQGELAELFPWGFVDGNLHPYAAEGAKTIAFEIAEQLDWDVPDYVVVPAGTGTNLFGIWKGFDELAQLGFTGRAPRIVAVQPVGADPLVRAYDRGDAIMAPLDAVPPNIALPITHRVTGHHAYEGVRKSHGTAVAVTDDEIRRALLDLGSREGIYCEPASAAALAGARKLVQRGALVAGSRVACILTSHGLKDARAIGGWFEAPTRVTASLEAVRRAAAG